MKITRGVHKLGVGREIIRLHRAIGTIVDNYLASLKKNVVFDDGVRRTHSQADSVSNVAIDGIIMDFTVYTAGPYLHPFKIPVHHIVIYLIVGAVCYDNVPFTMTVAQAVAVYAVIPNDVVADIRLASIVNMKGISAIIIDFIVLE